jgi:hypothetical protein
MKKLAVLAAVSLSLSLATPSLALVVAGREVPEAVQVGGRRLVLNGAGIRKRFFFKVYVGALYLPARTQDAGAIVAADEPKCVRVLFLRDVTRDALKAAYHHGIERNAPGPRIAELEAKLDELARLLPEQIREGSELAVAYVPGEGTTISTGDGSRGTVEGKEFADAMFRTWLGDQPADESLKQAMLGR